MLSSRLTTNELTRSGPTMEWMRTEARVQAEMVVEPLEEQVEEQADRLNEVERSLFRFESQVTAWRDQLDGARDLGTIGLSSRRANEEFQPFGGQSHSLGLESNC